MPQIRPITDLRNTTEISNICHAKNEPVFITKNGYGDMETYEELISNAAMDRAITDAEAEFRRTGELYDARDVLSTLRKKHFG